MNNRNSAAIAILLPLLILLAGLTTATAVKSSEQDIGIDGFDSVAYFKVGKAVPGDKAHAYRWHNMTWYFSSAENRDLFAQDPGRYAPQYDGYCAWAMTEERKAKTDPQVWRIVDGKLYLNCSESAYLKWSRDIPGNIEKADRNWRKLQENK